MSSSKRLVEVAVDPQTDGVRTCPKALEAERAVDGDPVFVQAAEVHDPELLAQSHPGSGDHLGWVRSENPADAAGCRDQRDLALRHSISLDEFRNHMGVAAGRVR